MKTTKKLSREEMIRQHESPDYNAFDGSAAERADVGPISGQPPISIRLSRPLLDALDRMAAGQHRKRSNLIQHILWEYVHAQDERK
jgi:hypothetical protein